MHRSVFQPQTESSFSPLQLGMRDVAHHLGLLLPLIDLIVWNLYSVREDYSNQKRLRGSSKSHQPGYEVDAVSDVC